MRYSVSCKFSSSASSAAFMLRAEAEMCGWGQSGAWRLNGYKVHIATFVLQLNTIATQACYALAIGVIPCTL